MSNLLDALCNIATLQSTMVAASTNTVNRATSQGEGLENFIKDAFAGTFNLTANQKLGHYAQCFSYQGSANRPPDLMLRGGDAMEIKKVESIRGDLQLNSSHPKSKLLSTSSLISKHCRDSENWEEKDFIYVIGHVNENIISSLWFIYGDIYAADEDVYIDLKNSISENIDNIPNINFSPSNELGRVNEMDPLKITHLRIRGMWLLKPPYIVFDYAHRYDETKSFQCFAFIPQEKYNSFPEESKDRIAALAANGNLSITDVQVKNPNNPVNLIDCKLIKITN